MSVTQSTPLTETDRQIADLMESYRHYKTDPRIPEPVKRDAAERMRPVWEKIALLQDPDGFENHLADVIANAHRERASGERKRPLCRCELPRHICDAKQGEIPRKCRTRDTTYLPSGDARSQARQYRQEHAGDVIVGEALESYRNLRAEIYQLMNTILIDLRAAIDSGDTTTTDEPSESTTTGDVAGPVLDPEDDTRETGAITDAATPDGDAAPDELADVESLDDLDREIREQLTDAQILELTDGEGPQPPEVCPNCETPTDSEFGGFVELSTDPSVDNPKLRGYECLNCEKTISGRSLAVGDYETPEVESDD